MGKIKGACISRAYTVDKNGPVVHWWIRSEDDDKRYQIDSTHDHAYFYGNIRRNAILDHPDVLEIDNKMYKSQVGTNLRKIYVKKPKSVSGYNSYDRFTHLATNVPGVSKLPIYEKVCEDNIEFADRCAIDNGIMYGMWADGPKVYSKENMGGLEHTSAKIHIATIDSEVRTMLYDPNDRIERRQVAFPTFADPRREILSLQILDSTDESVYVFKLAADRYYPNFKVPANSGPYSIYKQYTEPINFKLSPRVKQLVNGKDQFKVNVYEFCTEEGMLNYFINFIITKDFDIIAAFNGMDFDFPYIFARTRKLKINFNKLSPLGYVTLRLKGERSEDSEYADETDIRIPGRNLLDTRDLFIKKLRKKLSRQGLDNFAKHFLEVGKIEHDFIEGSQRRHSIDYEFFEQPKKFLEYAVYDVLLDHYIQKAMGIWPYYLKIVETTGVQIFNVLEQRKRVRQTSLFYAKKMGMVLEPEDYKGEKFKGAEVDAPDFVGKISMGADLDAASMYPSLIEASNISWDTLVVDHKIHSDPKFNDVMDITEALRLKIPLASNPLAGVFFRLDKIGLIPQMIHDGVERRDTLRKDFTMFKEARKKVIKLIDVEFPSAIESLLKDTPALKRIREIYEGDITKEMAAAIIEAWENDIYVFKVNNNSIYGNLPKFLGKCVTALGRGMIAFTRLVITKCGYPPNYTDTDSVIFSTKAKTVDEALVIAKRLQDIINKNYPLFAKKYNIDAKKLRTKTEEVYDPIVFVYTKTKAKDGESEAASKRYVKRIVGKDGRKVLEQDIEVEHTGIIKPQECSVFETELGNMLIQSIGNGRSNNEVIADCKPCIDKLFNISKYPKDNTKPKYSAEEIAFPHNFHKELSEYTVSSYILTGIQLTNEYGHLWSSSFKPIQPNDTAMMVFVDIGSIPADIPSNECWALNNDEELHPSFRINADKHFKRAISKFIPLITAVGIDPKELHGEKGLW